MFPDARTKTSDMASRTRAKYWMSESRRSETYAASRTARRLDKMTVAIAHPANRKRNQVNRVQCGGGSERRSISD